MLITTEQFLNQFNDCKDTDGEFDLKKEYRFSYKKLIQDDRLHFSIHKTWIDKLREYDGKTVAVIDSQEGTIDNKFSIARNWCDEIV